MYSDLPIRAEPYAHQKEAFTAAVESFRSGKSCGYSLLMEMGTGKSLTAIAISGRLYLDNNINKVLVVAPLSILGVWDEEHNRDKEIQAERDKRAEEFKAARDAHLAAEKESLLKYAELTRQVTEVISTVQQEINNLTDRVAELAALIRRDKE